MNNKILKNKVALITGSGNGIGRASALLFAEQGASVVVADINGLAGEETVNLIKQQNGKAIYINVNLTKAEDCKRMIDVTNETLGGLHILFNNAGIMHHQDGDIVNLEEKIWDMTVSVNLKSIFLSCKYGIPALIKSGGGSIINASSFVALRGSASANMAYSTSKAAIIALTQNLAAKYAASHIRVNTLCPGPTLTESFRRYLTDIPGREEKYLNLIPVNRFANVEEITKAALFLASDDASYINGTNLVVDGGISAIYATT